MAKNVVAQGGHRNAVGFHLEPTGAIHEDKVFDALERLEPGVGLSLVPIYLSNGHREEWMPKKF
jgi:hypothetical protein